MNRGTRKMTSTSSGKAKISIAKMFPLSWISKLRLGNDNEKSGKRILGRGAKNVKRNVVGFQEEKSCKAEKFYGEVEDNFWRLSFDDEGVQGRKGGRGCDQSLSCDWFDEAEISPSTCRSCGAKGAATKVAKKESKDFNDMLLDMKKTRESNPHIENKCETKGQITREPKISKASRRDGKLRNLDLHQLSLGPSRYANVKYAGLKGTTQKMVSEKGRKGDPNIQNVTVKDITEVDTVKPIQASIRISPISPSPLSSGNQENHHYEASTQLKLQVSKCEISREVNLAELSMGAGEERKSIYISKDSTKRRPKSGRSSKVKVYSPRTPSKAELCKIRALEDLKKTRMKTRVKEKVDQGKAALESLAVVKHSIDPQRDFRNSMLEMILDKGISRHEELEELLACYLILNSDEYHDMIIKVFRQVWFDLNKDRLDLSQGMQN